jgi:hypothetical protein
MPIDFCIDHSRRLVIAHGFGVFTEGDIFGYQRDVWSRPDVAGYNELVDMSKVEKIELPLPATPSIMQLARTSAAKDTAQATKFAIVAPAEFAFGLGRMYQAYRGAEPNSTKEVGVFHSLAQAMTFLEIDAVEEFNSSQIAAADRGRIEG